MNRRRGPPLPAGRPDARPKPPPGPFGASAGPTLIQVMARRLAASEQGAMRKDDRPYFLQRAEEELELAGRAAHEAAERAHSLLAGYYFDRAYGGDPAAEPPLAAE